MKSRSVAGNARDLDVLRSLAWAGFLSTSQVARLHFPSRRTAQRRLRALLDHGLVRAHLQGSALHVENVYTLGEKGAARLESAGTDGVRPRRVPRPQKLGHGLAIRDVLVAFLLAERAGTFSLDDFRFDEDLSQEPVLRAAGIIPDGLALVRLGERRLVAGCEVDLGTETTKRTLAPKLSAWKKVLSSRAFGDTMLLLVVSGEGRRRNFMRLLEELECAATVVLLADLVSEASPTLSRVFAPRVRAARIAHEEKAEEFQAVREGAHRPFRIVAS